MSAGADWDAAMPVDQAQAEDAGTPPLWLIEAIESAPEEVAEVAVGGDLTGAHAAPDAEDGGKPPTMIADQIDFGLEAQVGPEAPEEAAATGVEDGGGAPQMIADQIDAGTEADTSGDTDSTSVDEAGRASE